ncbi:unnamed protein product [Auanema sp. JU1783]|nr:unnamed protein product [Auanema sp. JU1783]
MTEITKEENDKKESPVVDSTGRTLRDYLKTEFGPNTIGIEAGADAPVMRFRPPFQRIAKYDTKADSLQLVIDNLTQRRLPINVAYVVALNYIKQNETEFEIEDVPFTEGGSEADLLREGANWAKKILDGITPYCQQIIQGTVDVEGLPKNWWNLAISSTTDRGRRKQQEDRMVVLPSLQFHFPHIKDSVSLFGVFDGHGGPSIATYAAAHLPFEVGSALEKSPEDRGEALKLAMAGMDKRVAARCQVEPWTGQGSTAVVSLVDDSFIHIRWLGDSNAYLLTKTGVKLVTVPHTPRDNDEAERIKNAGGELIFVQGELRVNGVLNLTRALGDLSGRPVISGDSDGIQIKREDDQYLLMFVCDGVCDGNKASDFHEMVKEFVNQNVVEDYHDLAEALVRSAIDNGSSDNCTCVIVFLRSPSDLWKLLYKTESNEEEEKFE